MSIFLLATVAIAAARPSINTNKTSRQYYHIGGDRISLGVIRFNADNWRTVDINKKVSNAPKMNYEWDDQWYHEYLPDSTNEILVLFWKNHDRHNQGWVAIKNTPDAWFYKKNSRSWKRIGDGKKVVSFWKPFGTKDTGNRSTGSLSIDIRNPRGRGDIIHVSFGY
ncbi:MAG: hypothetical protein D3920_00320 [Candidatus Electrothrix sp. AW2]|nr:hypothetical protein [Candidatus Electrothrix gigas]